MSKKMSGLMSECDEIMEIRDHYITSAQLHLRSLFNVHAGDLEYPLESDLHTFNTLIHHISNNTHKHLFSCTGTCTWKVTDDRVVLTFEYTTTSSQHRAYLVLRELAFYACGIRTELLMSELI